MYVFVLLWPATSLGKSIGSRNKNYERSEVVVCWMVLWRFARRAGEFRVFCNKGGRQGFPKMSKMGAERERVLEYVPKGTSVRAICLFLSVLPQHPEESRGESIMANMVRKYCSSHEEFKETKDDYEWVFCFHSGNAFQAAVDGLISHGFYPKKMSADTCILRDRILAPPIPTSRARKLIDEDSYQWLISRGFTFDEERFIRVRRNEVEKLENIVSEWE